MKQLFLGCVLIIVLGLGGFLYRNTIERPFPGDNVACTLEARLCPDGTGVRRTGPNCEFAACPFPNLDVPALGISFALPIGYAENGNAPSGDALIVTYEKMSLTPSVPHVIAIRRYPISAGKTANDVMLAETSYDTSGEPVKSMQEFTPVIINGRTYQSLTTDRFEAQMHTVYYLPRANDVLRFEILERDVTNWTDPSLVITELPEHKALLELLGTLQGA